MHDVAALTLLISAKPDPERDVLAEAWERRGGRVVRVDRFWDPPALDPETTRVYGADSFCLVLAEKLGLALVSPDDRILETIPRTLLQRAVRIIELSSVGTTDLPSFIKPVVPKQFRAAVYESLEALAAETRGLKSNAGVIVSEVVAFRAEARAFVLDGVVRTCAVYEGAASVADAAAFAAAVARESALPRTCVVDVGLLKDGVRAVVELNATWGAGLNGCDEDAVVDCIAAASGRAVLGSAHGGVAP